MAAEKAATPVGRWQRPSWLRLEVVIIPLLLLYPFFPVLDHLVQGVFDISLRLDRQLVNIFIFAILALALNLQVGYAGAAPAGHRGLLRHRRVLHRHPHRRQVPVPDRLLGRAAGGPGPGRHWPGWRSARPPSGCAATTWPS